MESNTNKFWTNGNYMIVMECALAHSNDGIYRFSVFFEKCFPLKWSYECEMQRNKEGMEKNTRRRNDVSRKKIAPSLMKCLFN